MLIILRTQDRTPWNFAVSPIRRCLCLRRCRDADLERITACRIVPRHRYLQQVHTQRHWPFPMTFLKLTDETFARDVARRPLDDFMAFRQHLTGGQAPSRT